MIVGGLHQCLRILLPASGEESRVVKIRFPAGPGIGKLVHHQHTFLVADLQQCLAGREVSASDRIIAGSLHCTDPPLLQLLKTGGSNDSKVMVDAATAQFRLNTVDPQTMLGIQLHSADAKPVRLFIFLIAPLHRGHTGVQVRGIHIPKLRILNLDSGAEGFSLRRQHGNGIFCLGDHIALVIHNFMPHFDIRYCLRDTANIGLNTNHGQIHFCLQGCQTHAVRGNMYLLTLVQIYIPVNSGAGIPPGAGDAVSHDHLHIVLANASKGGNVQQKRRIAIDMLAC